MAKKNDSLGDRMKGYEGVSRNFLTRRVPAIIRLDGKAFHTFTKGMEKPFDPVLTQAMQETMKYLCENIQGCVLGYTQSDEITLVLTDYATIQTDAWFGYNIQKMCSVSASMATMAFNREFECIAEDWFHDNGPYWKSIGIYELSITSDCGNYAYGWVPTHKSESFMHLMARLDSGYLLDKLASPCVINEEATFEAVKELMEAWGVDFSETDRWGDPVFDMDEIKDCCYQSNERDVHDALERKFEGTSMETCDDYDLWSCIQIDFTTNAKKIVQVFMEYIQPVCKKISDDEKRG